MKKCVVDGCPNEAGLPGTARGFCRAHYKRWYRYGDELEPERRTYSWKDIVCAEVDCGKPARANGLCANHYALARKNSDPTIRPLAQLRWRARRDAKREAELGRPRPDRCEICGEEGYGRKPSIVYDHCHVSGKGRGWLCDRCNKVLGLVKDNRNLLFALSEYLEINGGTTDNQRAERAA